MARNPLYFIKYPNNNIHVPPFVFELWMGYGSRVLSVGPVVQYIYDLLVNRPDKTLLVCHQSDGQYDIPAELVNIANRDDATIIATAVAGLEPRKNFFYCPASDDFFTQPVYDIFSSYHIPWEKKQNLLFWRGGVSGGDWRVNMVRCCLNIPRTDVKFVDTYSRPGCNPQETPELFTEKIDVKEQMKYKALLYIDGNSSASNATWIFASGSVPVMIMRHEFWFSKHLIPWVHYVPVKWDRTDLVERLQWIWDNDDAARKIAENALELSRTILTPDAQKEYIRNEVDRLVKERNVKQNTSPL